MLSNTAVPKYYGMFRDAVIRGEIPVCEKVSMQMVLIDRIIEDPRYYYDEDAVEGYIAFCENELTLTDGSPLHLLDTFKLWAEDVYGWYYFVNRSVYVPPRDDIEGHYENRRVKYRLRNKQYLIIPRGGAKTVYDSTHHAYGLIIDPATTEQVATAHTMPQAEETLAPIKTAITKARGPYVKFFTHGSIQNTTGSKMNRVKLASTKKGIENFLTNSILEVRPMDIDKLQGRRDKYATIDEWLSCDNREDVMSPLEQGCAKNKDWLIIATSSEGTVRNGIGDTIKMELLDILKGKYWAPNVSIWWYQLDKLEEIAYPELWIKAQPNLDKTVTYETYQLEVERAENSPSSRNDIIAKRFNIPMEGYTYFFTYEETLPHKKASYWKMPCALGMDLSQGNDFCAFTFLFPLGDERFGVKTINYISEATMMKLQLAMRQKYDEFVKEGTLVVMPGTILDSDVVYDDLDRHILNNEYDVRCVGYDPYGAKEFIKRWCSENGEFGVEKVIQGVKTESVPLGELKKLAENRLLFFDEEMMTYTMGNCIAIEDTNGNRKLLKKRYEAKIDSVAALMDAFIAYKLNKDQFE